MNPIELGLENYTSKFTRSYIAHLLRSNEMLAATLISIHNLHFVVSLVANIRKSMLDGTYLNFKETFLSRYYKDIV